MTMGADFKCENCRNYKGDCGKHFVDWNGHINYDCPSEAALESYCFEPNDEILKKQKEERIRTMARDLTLEEIQEALEIARSRKEEKQPDLKSSWLVTDMGYHSHKKKEDNDSGVGVTWLA